MFSIAKSSRIRRALLLATGQTTQYAGMLDDGYYKKGELRRYTVLTAGQYSGTVNIVLNGKTDVHNNACVFDELTGLMWSRTVSASVGPTSNGLLPWTTNGSSEGIFTYAAAANAASLAGYSDWRVPNVNELFLLQKKEQPNANPDVTAFPTGWNVPFWSSTTAPASTTSALSVYMTNGEIRFVAKGNATTFYCSLVRGPI